MESGKRWFVDSNLTQVNEKPSYNRRTPSKAYYIDNNTGFSIPPGDEKLYGENITQVDYPRWHGRNAFDKDTRKISSLTGEALKNAIKEEKVITRYQKRSLELREKKSPEKNDSDLVYVNTYTGNIVDDEMYHTVPENHLTELPYDVFKQLEKKYQEECEANPQQDLQRLARRIFCQQEPKPAVNNITIVNQTSRITQNSQPTLFHKKKKVEQAKNYPQARTISVPLLKPLTPNKKEQTSTSESPLKINESKERKRSTSPTWDDLDEFLGLKKVFKFS